MGLTLDGGGGITQLQENPWYIRLKRGPRLAAIRHAGESRKKVPLTKDIVNWTDIPPVNGYNIKTTIDKISTGYRGESAQRCSYGMRRRLGRGSADGSIHRKHQGDIQLEKNRAGTEYIEGHEPRRARLLSEPGSVVKTLSMMIALEDGIVTDVEQVIPTGRAFLVPADAPSPTATHATPCP